MTDTPVIGVFFGSRSAEHDVSIITALSAIIRPLELTKKYKVVPVYITKDGRWFSHPKLKEIALYSSGDIERFLNRQKPVELLFDNGLTLVFQDRKHSKQHIDIAFPATHGTYGEDGSLMGLFEMAGVPYVGCGPAASALAMDKVLAKLMAEAHGIRTPKMQFITTAEFEMNPAALEKAINERLTYPLFVKPAHLGSSIGITKVTKKSELQNALEVAAHYDSKIIIEEAVHNLVEVTLPILGNVELQPALLEQPLTQSTDFFDFDTKYMNQGKGGKKMGGKTNAANGAQGYSRLPAELPRLLYEKAEQTGLAVYRALGCEGIARVDMLIDTAAQQVYFNEVNPLPGSLYAHNWRASGVTGIELVERLIELAKERFATQQKTETTFKTNFLQQF
jgi:D-alanine-D-alanine ligase